MHIRCPTGYFPNMGFPIRLIGTRAKREERNLEKNLNKTQEENDKIMLWTFVFLSMYNVRNKIQGEDDCHGKESETPVRNSNDSILYHLLLGVGGCFFISGYEHFDG